MVKYSLSSRQDHPDLFLATCFIHTGHTFASFRPLISTSTTQPPTAMNTTITATWIQTGPNFLFVKEVYTIGLRCMKYIITFLHMNNPAVISHCWQQIWAHQWVGSSKGGPYGSYRSQPSRHQDTIISQKIGEIPHAKQRFYTMNWDISEVN